MFRCLFIAMAGAAFLTAASDSHASASSPQWALMAEGPDMAFYVDRASIKDLPARTLRFRVLIDVMMPDIVAGVAAYSSITEWVMDCNAATMGLLRVNSYENHCGEGPETAAEGQPSPEMRPVVPESAYSVAFEALCLPPDTSEEDINDFARYSWLASRPSGACSQ